MTSSHLEDVLESKKKPSQRSSQHFSWLMTQEHNLISVAPENQLASSGKTESVFLKSGSRPFTQVDFPSFTQLMADEDSFALTDPYKPPPNPRNPLELSELSWKVIHVLPEKTDILNNLVKVLENTDVQMKNGVFKIFLKQNLESAPYKKTFLATCPLILNESSSSDSSSQESSEDSDSEISTEGHESQSKAASQNVDAPREVTLVTQQIVANINNDLDISSSSSGSEDEDVQISASISSDVLTANKFPSPELPSESQTQSKFITDMPNIGEFASVGTQTDLSMEDIERFTRKRATKGSQVRASTGASASDQQHVKRRKKSIVRVGLPRLTKSKKVTSG